MIARVEHHKMVALAALVAVLCVLLVTALVFRVQPVQTTLPSANDAKVSSRSESDAGTGNRANLTRNLMGERHAELVARDRVRGPR